MKINFTSIGCWSALIALLAFTARGHCQTRDQILNLQAGWNAIFLEVQPRDTDPAVVFANSPIDIVARYFPRTSPVQYLTDPAEAPWNEPGWGVWYAPSRAESVVSSLYAITGNKPYLVHTKSAFVWKVTGEVSFQRISWQADSFNLLGFCASETSPPTFERLFAQTGGRIGKRIYRLDAGGRWQPVTLLAATTVRSGEAYWIYCRGNTDHQGPMEVRVPGRDGLDFGSSGSRLNVEFFNRSADPVSVTVEVLPGTGELRLAQVIRDLPLLKDSYLDLEPATLLTVAPGQVEMLRLEIRREEMSAGTQTRLLKVTTSHGLCYWVPVRAQKSDPAAQR